MTSTVDVAADPAGTLPARRGVHWWTVLPVAAVMAYADTFWMISLRGAAGAVQRTDAPFDTWLREATLSVPVFTLAVLAALTLALRLFGPAPRRLRHLSTALMVVVAGTLTGIIEIAASSAYDFHLESQTLLMMNSMRGTCAGGTSCLDQLQTSSMDLQLRAVALGSVLILTTNLVAVGWVMALRGGRLEVATTPTAPHHRATPLTLLIHGARTSQADDLRLLLVTGLAGSAVIHAAVVPEHLTQWAAAGVFLLALTAAQTIVAGLLILHRPGAPALAALVSAGPLLLWLYSRTLGIPFGPHPGLPQPIGLPDTAASALEIATLIAAILATRQHTRLRQRPAATEHIAWLIVIAITATTIIGITGSNLGWFSILSPHMIMTTG